MEKLTKETITNALQVIDTALSQFRGTRQEHELVIANFKLLVDISNEYLKEEPKKEE